MDDAEFEAALAAQVASPEETPAEEVEPEAVVEEAPEAIEEPVVEAVEEHVVEDERLDALQAYLNKYGGDVEKAYEASAHAQRKIGEQGQELNELRQIVEEFVNRPEPRAPQSPFINDQIQEAIVNNPEMVARWAQENNNPAVYDAAMDEWFEQAPRAASRFEMQQAYTGLANTLAETIAPEINSVREQSKQRAVVDAHRSLKESYPDFQQVLETATEAEVAGIDRNLLAQVQEANPQAALEMVYRWVKAGRSEREAQERQARVEQTREEKRQAAVVTAEASVEQTAPSTMEKLAASMLEPDPWSVRDGLTR